MQLIVSKAQALERKMVSVDGSAHSTEQQLRQALLAGQLHLCHCIHHLHHRRLILSPAAEHNEAETLVQLEAKARALNHAQQQHASEVQAIMSQHNKDKVAMEGRIR
jgi:hypothetical protein